MSNMQFSIVLRLAILLVTFSATNAVNHPGIDNLVLEWFHKMRNEGNSPNPNAATMAPLVNTINGTIMGSMAETVSGLPIYQYLGVPFAKPPVGELRFKAPQSYEGWGDTIFNATRHPHSCTQFLTNLTQSEEDCLYLSVHSRRPGGGVGTGPLLPVVFYIHGGAFFVGQNSYYDASKILEHEVVLVTVQYRLGPLGFFYTGDNTVSGNNAMKDIVLGLRWVQENIANFGGDPNRVTVMGTSGGAAAALYMLLSPLAHGLYHGIIAMSGAPIMEFALDRNPVESSRRLAKYMNCSNESSQELVDCLMERDAMNISKAGVAVLLEDFYNFKCLLSGSAPVIEGNVPGAFLPDEPLKLLKEGYIPDVPVLLGTVQTEGILPLSIGHYLVLNPKGLLNDTEYIRDQLITDMLATWNVDESTNGASVSQAMAAGYLKPGSDRGNLTEIQYELLDWMTVMFMKAAVKRTADILSRRISSVYLYNFEYYNQYGTSIYDWAYGIIELIIGGEKPNIKPGVCHGDDLLYMFRFPLIMGPNDTQFSRTYVNLFTNFVIYGNPTPEETDTYPIWPKYDLQNENYMVLDLPFRVTQDYTSNWRLGMPGV